MILYSVVIQGLLSNTFAILLIVVYRLIVESVAIRCWILFQDVWVDLGVNTMRLYKSGEQCGYMRFYIIPQDWCYDIVETNTYYKPCFLVVV